MDLPSKGLLYPKDNPLSSGQIEIKYMTAREEDILTSQNLIQKGVVIDELLKSLVINKEVKFDTISIGDKNAIMLAARVFGYGKDYTVDVTCPSCGILEKEVKFDLTTLDHKEIDEKFFKGKNEYTFKLPISKRTITYKFLTHKDEQTASKEIERIVKVSKGKSAEVTTRLRHQILSVDGDEDREMITNFINNEFFAQDSRAYRTEYERKMPNVDFEVGFYCDSCGTNNDIDLPISVNFFWPSR